MKFIFGFITVLFFVRSNGQIVYKDLKGSWLDSTQQLKFVFITEHQLAIMSPVPKTGKSIEKHYFYSIKPKKTFTVIQFEGNEPKIEKKKYYLILKKVNAKIMKSQKNQHIDVEPISWQPETKLNTIVLIKE